MLTCFNLRREAAPHATCKSCLSIVVQHDVSISDEKPLHMRLCSCWAWLIAPSAFQSQTRSRSTCDCDIAGCGREVPTVSISDEKPLHMRLLRLSQRLTR